MDAGIYKITNTVNGKVYIGSAINIERRFKQHIYSLNKGAHYNPHLQSSWNKYGEDAFVFEVIIEVEDVGYLYDIETKFIHEYRAFDRQRGYNLQVNAGKGMLGMTHRKESLSRMSRSHRKTWDDPVKREKLLKSIGDRPKKRGKLTDGDVREIKKLLNERIYGLKSIGEKFGVGITLISLIQSGARYSDLS